MEDKPGRDGPSMSLSELQSLIRTMYSSKDEARGIDGTFMWLMEEVGELAAALREGSPDELAREFADVLHLQQPILPVGAAAGKCTGAFVHAAHQQRFGPVRNVAATPHYCAAHNSAGIVRIRVLDRSPSGDTLTGRAESFSVG